MRSKKSSGRASGRLRQVWIYVVILRPSDWSLTRGHYTCSHHRNLGRKLLNRECYSHQCPALWAVLEFDGALKVPLRQALDKPKPGAVQIRCVEACRKPGSTIPDVEVCNPIRGGEAQ